MRLRCLALWRQCLMLFAGLMLLGPASGAPPAPVHLPPQPEPVRADFFGTHLHALVAEPLRAQPVTLWPERQIGALRLWDAGLRWADLEPQRGAWQFERMDAYVDAATRRGVRIVHVLGSTPRWASARPNEPCPYGQGCSAEPADFSRWDDYVRTLVRRYRGRIHDYELWNEPYFHDLPADRNKPQAFFSGTAATLVEMARRAHAIVRAEDPAARLLSPGFVGGPYRLDLYLRAGGGEWMSALAYHLYADDDDGALVLVDAARATLRRHGLGSLAIVNTETGFAADAADPSRAAALLARSMIVTAFAGVQGYYHYAWDNQRSGMLDARGGTDSVTARAYGNVRRWLLGTRMDGCNTTAASLVRCTGRRDGQTLVIYWRQHGREDVPLEALPASGTATVQSAIDAQPAAMVGSRRIGVGSVPLAIWSDSP